jgi:hypothetical protein
MNDADTKVNVHADVLKEAQAYTPDGKRKFGGQKKTEKDAEYFERLVGHMAEIPDEHYEKLPDHVKSWYEGAAQSFNSKAEIEAPEGFVSAFVDAGTAAPKEKAAKSTEPKQPTVRKEREHNPNSIGSIIRRTISLDRSVTVDQMIELLKSKGIADPSRVSVSSYVGDVKETLRIAAEQGWSAPA